MKAYLARIGSSVLTLVLGIGLFSQDLQGQDVNLYSIPNQSASFIRMPSREATTDVDAVYFNPAGLVELDLGFHLSVNNQLLRQKSIITSDYPRLNDVPTVYEGVAKSYVFPSIYGAIVKDRFVYSFGILMVGGAGGAAYDNLPIADGGVADIIPSLRSQVLNVIDQHINSDFGVDPGYAQLDGYRYNFSSEGYGFSPGLQLGISWEASETFAFSFGGRFVQQYVVAESTLENIEIQQTGNEQWYTPAEYLTYVASDDRIRPLDNAIAGALSDGFTPGNPDGLLPIIEVDISQYGFGITPILSVHIKPSEVLNIAVKYEHNTAISLKTTVNDGKDGVGTFTDGEEVKSDLPGFLSAGIRYRPTTRIRANFGFRYMFDKSTDWAGREKEILGNYYELAIAGEYQLSEKLALSTGYTYNQPNVTGDYQNEVDYRLSGHTGSIGGAYNFTEKTKLNLGVMYTLFNSEEHPYTQVTPESAEIAYSLGYEKNALVVGIGMDFKFGTSD
ncbi:MAG: long-chain fatty acid transport protein [Limisphaerales bacterium]|jgi:long-chain fatty acid transport protein